MLIPGKTGVSQNGHQQSIAKLNCVTSTPWRSKHLSITYCVTLNQAFYKYDTFNSSKNSCQIDISTKCQFTDKGVG